MKRKNHKAQNYIICTPDLGRIEKFAEQSEIPKMVKQLRKEQGTKKLLIFCRAYLIENDLKRQKKL